MVITASVVLSFYYFSFSQYKLAPSWWLQKRPVQWWCYTRACQVIWPGWKIHRPGSGPGSTPPSPAYCFALVIMWTGCFICFSLIVKQHWQPVFWGRQLKKMSTFLRKKVHPGDLAGGFSDLEMTWLFYCAGAATGPVPLCEPM